MNISLQWIAHLGEVDWGVVRARLAGVTEVELVTPWGLQAKALSMFVSQWLPGCAVSARPLLEAEWKGADSDLDLIAANYPTRCSPSTSWRFVEAARGAGIEPWRGGVDEAGWGGLSSAVASFRSARRVSGATHTILFGWDWGHAEWLPALAEIAQHSTGCCVLLPVTPAMGRGEELWQRHWEAIANDVHHGDSDSFPYAGLARALVADAEIGLSAETVRPYHSFTELREVVAAAAGDGRVSLGPSDGVTIAACVSAGCGANLSEIARAFAAPTAADRADALADFFAQGSNAQSSRTFSACARALRRNTSMPFVAEATIDALQTPVPERAPLREFVRSAERLLNVCSVSASSFSARAENILVTLAAETDCTRAEFLRWFRAFLQGEQRRESVTPWRELVGVPLPKATIIAAHAAFSAQSPWAPSREWSSQIEAVARLEGSPVIPFLNSGYVEPARLSLVVASVSESLSIFVDPRAERAGPFATLTLTDDRAMRAEGTAKFSASQARVREACLARRANTKFGPFDFCGRSDNAKPITPSGWGKFYSRPAEVFIDTQLRVAPRDSGIANPAAQQKGVWVHEWLRVAATGQGSSVPECWIEGVERAVAATIADEAQRLAPRGRALLTESRHCAVQIAKALNAASAVYSSALPEFALTPTPLQLPSGKSMLLQGRCDLVLTDKPFDGSVSKPFEGMRVHVVDAKTGAVPPLRGKSAIERREGLQLIGYAAWFLVHGARAVDLTYLAPDGPAAAQLTVDNLAELEPLFEELAALESDGRFGWLGGERLPISTLIPPNLAERFVATHGIDPQT